MNTLGTKTLVVEMGVGMRITKAYGQSLSEGILNMMSDVGIIERPLSQHGRTSVSTINSQVYFINSPSAGVFIPSLEHNVTVTKGEKIGEIIDPLLGVAKDELLSPCDGLLFTIREYPVVYEGSLIARILEEGK